MKKFKEELSFEFLKPRLTGLGFAFYGPSEVADPEKTILDVIQLGKKESKVLKMLIAWLDKTRDLIHVERLRVLANDLSKDAFVILGVVALKQVRAGDRRFSILVELAKSESARSSSSFSSEEEDPYLIEKYGVDKEFNEFGIRTAFLQPADPKKILTLEVILAQNPWLRFRTLIGANFRADIAYIMACKLARNPYQAAKLAGCSQETAYRLWKGLLLYPTMAALVD